MMSVAMMVVARLSISLSFHNNRVRNLHNGCIHGDSILAQQRQLLRLPSFHSSHDHIHHIHDVRSHDGSSQAQHQPLSFHNSHDHIHHIHDVHSHDGSSQAQHQPLSFHN